MIEEQKYIASRLKPEIINTCMTTILLGRSASIFKKIYKGDMHTITTADEVRDFLSKWSVAPSDKPIVFEDLSLMTSAVQNYLLKFVEEPPSPIIMLASQDNVSPIILSRCRNIIKVSPTPLNFDMSIRDFLDYKQQYEDEQKMKVQTHQQPRMVPFPIVKESFMHCPEFLYNTVMCTANLRPSIKNFCYRLYNYKVDSLNKR